MKTKRPRVALFVDPDVWQALAEQAAQRRVPQAELAREAMRRFVEAAAA
jgi:hypothetical protein